MANEIRLRRNNEAGTITDNPLAIGATTINSAGFASLPVVGATNSMILILDPQEVGGTAEIVRVTAHTAAATSVTVVRGQEGSVARSHVFNTTWQHGPVTSDYTEVLTSSTRPSVPYEGELIYETDTDTIQIYNGTAWRETYRDGAWVTWSPTLTNLTLGNGTVSAVYSKVGRTVNFRFKFTLGTTSAVGASPQFTIPFTAHADYAINMPIGEAVLLDSAVQAYFGWPIMISTTTIVVTALAADVANAINRSVSATVPFTWGTGDIIMCIGTYEAAS